MFLLKITLDTNNSSSISFISEFKDICEESVAGLIAYKPRSIYCIDQLWKKLQKTENVYSFPERVGKQREDYSDICKRIVNHNV